MLQHGMHTEPEHPFELEHGGNLFRLCVESINAHSLQTSQSHVLVAWMVSPADSENNLIIIVLSGSGSSETGLELSDSSATLK